MKIILSPAKTMNFKGKTLQVHATEPVFQKEATLLADLMKSYTADELKLILNVSPALAAKTYLQYQQFDTPQSPRRESIFTFCGLVFNAFMGEEGPDVKMLRYAQDHLRILSGLYGVLRPFDLIQPYRLDVANKIDTPEGDNLYKFWTPKVTTDLLSEGLGKALINLASDEYSRMVDFSVIEEEAPVITVAFKEKRGDKFRVITTDTKKARGQMARYIIENRLTEPEQLKEYQVDDYAFYPDLSSEKEWVFVR